MSQKEKQLMVAVDKGHTKLIETLILQGTSVNCRVKDDGSTPLIKAARNRNHVVQKLLLQHGADITSKNTLGLTSLHYTAEAGDNETLKLLLAYQSPLNAPDVEGCTPLHYAAKRNNQSTAEILVFCGADVDHRNKKGASPFKINKTEEFRKLALESRKVLEGIKNRDIVIEHDELFPGKVSYFKSLDLTVFTPDEFKLTSLSFLCRRVRPEFCADSLRPEGKEILISDAFEYITTTVHVQGIVELEVPLYDHQDPYEKIQIKTNHGVIADPAAIIDGPNTMSEHSGVLRWKLRIRLDITKTKSFILITIPKLEKFPVSSGGGDFVSEVDKFINIKVAPNTFSSGTVNLEVIPVPVYKSESYKNVLSIGHFYDLHHSLMINQFQEDGVTFTSPLPHEFENEGELCFLAADVPRDFDPDQHDPLDFNIWEILNRDPKAKKGRVSCSLSHFSTHVLAEKRKRISDADFKQHVNEIHTKALKRAKVVRFFAVLKPMSENIFQTILECTIPQKINDRLNFWRSQDFLVLTPESTSEYDTQEKQEYDIVLSGNIKKFSGTPKLQFHSKRENYQTISVLLTNKEEPFGSLDLVEIPQEKELTSIALWLSGMPVKDTPRKKDTFLGFTKEELLKKIASNLGPKWSQFCVLLGIPFHKVEKIRTKSENSVSLGKNVVKILLEWRKNSQHLDDMGVVDLVTALSRVGRNDIADLVHEDLREWLKKNEIEKGDRFYKWAENALNGTVEISRKSGYPEPMSDEFFVLLVEKFATPEFQHLGVLMGIPENQNSDIFADTTFPNHQYKVLRMLIVARERHLDRMESLTDLLDSLEATENDDCLEWIRNCTKKWVQNNQGKKNRTKFQLDLEHMVRREAGEEKDEEGVEGPLGIGYELEQDEKSYDKQSLKSEAGNSQPIESGHKKVRETDEQSVKSKDNDSTFGDRHESEKQIVKSEDTASEQPDFVESKKQNENSDSVEFSPVEKHGLQSKVVNPDNNVHQSERDDVLSENTASERQDVLETKEQTNKSDDNESGQRKVHGPENGSHKFHTSESNLQKISEPGTGSVKSDDTASKESVKSDDSASKYQVVHETEKQTIKLDDNESDQRKVREPENLSHEFYDTDSRLKKSETESVKSDDTASEHQVFHETEKQTIKPDDNESDQRKVREPENLSHEFYDTEFQFKKSETESVKSDNISSDHKGVRESNIQNDKSNESKSESKDVHEVDQQSVKSNENDTLQETHQSESEVVKLDDSDSKPDIVEADKDGFQQEEIHNKGKEDEQMNKNDSKLIVPESVKDEVRSDENSVKSDENGIQSNENGAKSDNNDSELGNQKVQTNFNDFISKDMNETMEQSIKSNDGVSKHSEEPENLKSDETNLRDAVGSDEKNKNAPDTVSEIKELDEPEKNSNNLEKSGLGGIK
uniref:Uncharacterized protein LOC111119690 n=1 Tax=Crassostrea virginica TaxID=6565 RepID=A0A8B8CJ95_CRAVI|nr:uncharacterized protein LOC111119690 [Crassostrea virginica]XP_022315820.1 uncharacterized protein LOC111119690 [Crassostrea virginica]XP_022315821.1 uncharacterized protein LOC111119690 [Crassostrea virginica]